MKLESPSVEYKQSYLDALEEAEGETGETLLDKPEEDQSFESFVQQLRDHAKGKHLPKGWVPETVLWLIDNKEFIGRASIRHELTDHLLKIGGQIGYYVRPSKRHKGYGKMLLRLTLKEAKKLGISNALITCDITNLPSKKIIESNGGILENTVDNDPGKPKKGRYWINIK